MTGQNFRRHFARSTAAAILAILAGAVALSVTASGASRGLPEPRGDGAVYRADGNRPEHQLGAAPAGGEGRVHGATVIGSDNRVQVEDTEAYPWSAITWLGLYDSDGYLTGECTATFIGPTTLLTAGHCLYSAETGWTSDIIVVPGKSGEYEPFGWDYAASWWVPDGWIDSEGAPEYDWGLITLADDTLGETVGWLTMARLTTETLAAPDFEPAIAGYPGDVDPPRTLWFDYKPAFLDVDDLFLYYDIDTAPGASGSAVFSSNVSSDLIGYVVGIHTYGETTPGQNKATRIDEYVLADLIEGCAQMECDFPYVDEDGGDYPEPSPTPDPPAARPFRATAPQLSRD